MLNLNKSRWKKYKFKDIATNISERVEPKLTELTMYIGLEHIDSESININRYGTPHDVIGTKLKAYKGDVIFGKRRAYLRKAAVVPSDCICSAHSLILRANKELLLPELFPFIFHSDVFTQTAINISEGSLSPTIKWSTLAKQEFLIPPIDEQMKLSDFLLSIEKLEVKNKQLHDNLNNYFKIARYNLISGIIRLGKFKKKTSINHCELGDTPSDWMIMTISDVFQRNITRNHTNNSNVLTISANEGLINQEEYFNRKVSSKKLTNYYYLNKNDFCYNKSYSDGYPFGVIKRLSRYENGVVSPLYICFRIQDSQSSIGYYAHYFESGFFNHEISRIAHEGARNHGLLNVGVDDFLNLRILKPTLEEQCLISDYLNDLQTKIHSNYELLVNLNKIKKSILNSIIN